MSNVMKVWSNGQLVEPEETKVSLLSHGFSRGSAIFDVFGTYPSPSGTLAFRMDAHLDRLINSANVLEMDIPYSKAELMTACAEVVKINNMGTGLVKILAYWGGESAVALVPNEPLDVTIFCVPGTPDLGLGDRILLSACISKWRKLDSASVPTDAKACANYLNGYLARKDAVNRGCDLGIMLDKNNMLAEGSIEAVFIVKDGILKVPPLDHVLKSISRESIIDVALHAGIPVEITAISKEELVCADEIFAAHTLIRVMPIERLDSRCLSAPGPITSQVMKLMEDLFSYKTDKFMSWFQPLT